MHEDETEGSNVLSGLPFVPLSLPPFLVSFLPFFLDAVDETTGLAMLGSRSAVPLSYTSPLFSFGNMLCF